MEQVFVMADAFWATFRAENFEDRRFDVRVFWQIWLLLNINRYSMRKHAPKKSIDFRLRGTLRAPLR